MALGLWTSVAVAQPAADPEVPPDHDAPEQGGESSDGAALPLRLTARPLTLPRGKVVITSGLGVDHARSDLESDGCIETLSGTICGLDPNRSETTPSSSAGVAVGLIDALEIGLVPLRLRAGTDVLGEAENPLRDPLLYLQAAALRREHIQLGFGYQVYLPLRSDTKMMTQAVSLDLLARSRFVRADASTFVRFDSPVRRRTSLFVEERVITPGVAVRVTGQITDPFAIFFGFQSSFFDAQREGHSTDIRAGLAGTVRRSTGEPLADIRFTFGALDVKREKEGLTTCRSDEPGCGVEPRSAAPMKSYSFQLGAVFYFHEAW